MEHLEPRQKSWIMVAIVAAMLFASLNQTVVGTVLPRIVDALGNPEYLTWVFTLYMLTSSVSGALAGRLSDIYGRKPLLVGGVIVFSAASFACGLSGSLFELIAWRGVQGIGGGAVMTTAFAAVADLFPPRERGRWQGVLASAFGLSSVLGPAFGGLVVDHFDWHWVFWIFLPVGAPALYLLWRLFPSTPRTGEEPLDVLGAGFFCTSLVPLLLAFSWAGTRYAWSSVEVLALLGVAVASGISLFVVERRAARPVLPLHLFARPTVALSNGVSFFIGAGMFGAVIYTPLFVQNALGASATSSGFATMPLTLGLVVASSIAGQLIARTGRYKKLALAGLVVIGLGAASLAMMDESATMVRVAAGMAVMGLGIGVGMPVFTLTVQNVVETRDMGVATASVQLSRQLGGVIGASVMGAVLSQRMGAPAAGKAGLVAGVQGAFWISTAAMGIAFVLALLLPEVPLRTSNEEPSTA